MSKAKENIIKNVEMMKESLKLSDSQFEKVFGLSKEEGMTNVLNAIFKDLEKIKYRSWNEG